MFVKQILAQLGWQLITPLPDRERLHLKHEQPGEVKGRGGGKPKDMSKKAILLSGPPGIGKTSSASIISRYVCSGQATVCRHFASFS